MVAAEEGGEAGHMAGMRIDRRAVIMTALPPAEAVVAMLVAREDHMGRGRNRRYQMSRCLVGVAVVAVGETIDQCRRARRGVGRDTRHNTFFIYRI